MAPTTNSAEAVVYLGPRQLELREFPFPELGPDDMLLEVSVCGIDGSEVHMYRGEYDWLNQRVPVILGDEIVGRVVQLGADAAQRRSLALGDRVVVESRWPCNSCRSCKMGQYYLCTTRERFEGYGTLSTEHAPALWGGYATHVYVPGRALAYKVPDELSDEAAVISCSALANGIRWTEVGGVTEGTTLAIVGPGPQGLSCGLAASQKGANVVVLGIPSDVERLAMAEALGLTPLVVDEDHLVTKGKVEAVFGEVDVVIDAAGAPSAKDLALELVRPMGTVVNVAVTNPSAQMIDWNKVRRKETLLVNPVSHPHRVEAGMQLAVTLGQRGIDVGAWVTHRYPLLEAETALQVAGYETDEQPVKVILQFGEHN